MRNRAPLLLCFALPLADEPKDDPALRKQIDQLVKLGARLTFDDRKRVSGVNLRERKIADADLALLAGLRHLEELDLTADEDHERRAGASERSDHRAPALPHRDEDR